MIIDATPLLILELPPGAFWALFAGALGWGFAVERRLASIGVKLSMLIEIERGNNRGSD